MAFIYNFCQFIFLSTVVFFLIAYSPTFLDVDPQDAEPINYHPLSGPLQVNEKLNKLQTLFENELKAPESLAVHKGKIYTGLQDGRIVEIANNKVYKNISLPLKTCAGPWEKHICGVPLGIRVTSKGIMYMVDSMKGLYKVNIQTGVRELLVKTGTLVDGKAITFLDDLFVDEQRNFIYMTDANTKWDFSRLMYAMLERNRAGRVLMYDMKSESLVTLTSGLIFANGIQLSHDKKALLISDSARSCIIKYHLEGPKKGQQVIFVGGLPGYPDNIRPSRSGGYWIAISLVSEPGKPDIFDRFYTLPKIARKVLLRVMDRISVAVNFVSYHLINSHKLKLLASLISEHGYLMMINKPDKGLIIEVNKDGKIIRSMYGTDQQVIFISEVLEQDNGDLYLGSFAHPFLGYIPSK